MDKLIRSRNGQLLILLAILMTILIVRLFLLTVVQGKDWDQQATTLSTKNVDIPAPRGEIRDRYGRLLAGSRSSFTVQFNAADLKGNEQINQVSSDLIKILEQNGDTYIDNFPILLENGGYVYTYQKDIEAWLSSQSIPTDFTAKQAFEELELRNSIDINTDKFEAQTQLQNMYGIYPPISVRSFKYTKDLDKEAFLGRYNLKTNLTAEQAFKELRKKMEIDPALSDEEARKIMIIRNELAAQGYNQYIPAKIAYDVSNSTVIWIKEKGKELPGVEVLPESVRYYPNEKTACHVLGYLGKISENDKKKYVDELGYNPNDMVGQDGIERVFESTLKGTDGKQTVQVNAMGERVKVIGETKPKKGKDVYLTIDLDLQKMVEQTLHETLTKLQVGGTYQSPMGLSSYHFPKASGDANVGAAVVLDVATSDVLAMVSDPGFDPNLFVKGISDEDWNSLQSENPRDSLAPRPLYNVAAMTAVQPGSTFKMVTATAGMECGLDPTKRLYDGGAITLGNKTYGCWIWNQSGGKRTHGYVNMMEALEVSCNYYFYDVAAGYDFYKKKSLGLKEPMTVEKITDYAQQYGLGLPTGIEISENVIPVPTKERKMNKMKGLLRNDLKLNAEIYFTDDVLKDDKLLTKDINTIVSWIEENPSRGDLIDRLAQTGIKESQCETVADRCKFTYFNQAKWTTGDRLNLAIGQGENAYTPLQMANYVATIGNKGVHNKVSLIRGIEGEGVKEREPGTKVNISDPAFLDYIIDGMKLAVYGSRPSLSICSTLPVEVAVKTGTAQNQARKNPPDEVEFVKSNLSRLDSSLSWSSVEAEMTRLMKDYPEIYTTRDKAVRKAVTSLSKGKVTPEKIDNLKPPYKDFAWVVALAPADDPKIAVAALVFQGDTSTNLGPMIRDIIAKYLDLNKDYVDFDINTRVTQ